MILLMGPMIGGCASTNGNLKIYAVPRLPAISWTRPDFALDMNCLSNQDFENLTGYIIRMQSVLRKYQSQAIIMNGQ